MFNSAMNKGFILINITLNASKSKCCSAECLDKLKPLVITLNNQKW